jgi:trk system potassium uptake protein TrkH
VGHFNSGYVEGVIIVFTLLSSINFTLYYNLLRGKWKQFFSNRELLTYFSLLGGGVLLVFLDLRLSGCYQSSSHALREALFETVAWSSTAGHVSADYTAWPLFSQCLLLFLSCAGACSTSTGGGMKIVRFQTMLSILKVSVQRRLHPRAYVAVRVGDRALPEETVNSVISFLLLYVMVFVCSVLVLSLDDLDFATSFGAVFATLNNVGVGVGMVGPGGSFAVFSAPCKLYLCFLMLLGRLELYTVLLLFTPAFWKSGR